MIKQVLGAVVIGVGAIASTADAAAIYAFEEVDGNVVGTLSGSLDISNVTSPGSLAGTLYSSLVGIQPNNSVLWAGDFGDPNTLTGGTSNIHYVYGPYGFGDGNGLVLNCGVVTSCEDSVSVVGDGIGLRNFATAELDENGETLGWLTLDQDYSSGDELSANMTFFNQSFTSLSMVDGDYDYFLSNGDKLTLSFTGSSGSGDGNGDQPSVVPLPASLPLLLAGFLGLGLMRHYS